MGHWLPTAAVTASHRIEGVGVKINPKVVDAIYQGKIHIA